jgi:hypothetical protein
VRLRHKKQDGNLLWVDLLRPVEWLDVYEARPGETIYLDPPEMGAVGDAEVLEVLPCAPIDTGAGAVVTGPRSPAARSLNSTSMAKRNPPASRPDTRTGRKIVAGRSAG